MPMHDKLYLMYIPLAAQLLIAAIFVVWSFTSVA